MDAEQLTLALNLRDDATFANFHPGENSAVLAHLQTFAEPFIYLWGPLGSGRTHLLQACCHALAPGQALYLDLADDSLSPSVLMNMEYFYQVCLDNIEAVIGQSAWEMALFHFYNRALEQSTRLLIASAFPPVELPVNLPDLGSRFCSGLVFRLNVLTDDQKISALQMRARGRGLNFSEELGNFLINRYPRNMSVLFATLEMLDQAALVAKRPLTIPFVKKILS